MFTSLANSIYKSSKYNTYDRHDASRAREAYFKAKIGFDEDTRSRLFVSELIISLTLLVIGILGIMDHLNLPENLSYLMIGVCGINSLLVATIIRQLDKDDLFSFS